VAGLVPSLAEPILAGVGAAVDDIHVARAGKVTAYDALTNTAFVKPMVKRAVFGVDADDRSYEELPEIPFVPVLWPRAGAYVVTMPLAVGDTVLLVFCDVSHAEWRVDGGESEPADARRHSVGWPVAVPGLYPDNQPLSSAALDVAARIAGAIIGEHGGNNRVEFTSTGIKIGADAIDFVALATPTQAGIAAAMAAANAGISAAVSMISTFNSHTHSGVTAGAGVTGPPVIPAGSGPATAGPAGSVAATRTRAK
jgi:hypothetical protein